MSIRFSADQSADTYNFALWDDHDAEGPFGWTSIIEGATSIVAEIATAYVPPDDTVKPPVKEQPQGPWRVFVIDVATFRCRANVAAVAKDREYLVRLTVDGVVYPEFSIRLSDWAPIPYP